MLAVAVVLGGLAPTRGPRQRAAARWLERGPERATAAFAPRPAGRSSAAITGWAALGLEAAGRNPLDVAQRGHVGDRLPARERSDGIRSTGDLERTILALDGAGVSARRFGGRDLVAELRRRRSATGSFEGQVNLTAFGILALRSAGAHGVDAPPLGRLAAPSAERRRWLGLSSATPAATPTAPAPRSRARGRRRPGPATRARAPHYLRRVQRSDGGFALAGAEHLQLPVDRLGDPGR